MSGQASSRRTMCKKPFPEAMKSGEKPLKFVRFTSAPAAINLSTPSGKYVSTASNNEVIPESSRAQLSKVAATEDTKNEGHQFLPNRSSSMPSCRSLAAQCKGDMQWMFDSRSFTSAPFVIKARDTSRWPHMIA